MVDLLPSLNPQSSQTPSPPNLSPVPLPRPPTTLEVVRGQVSVIFWNEVCAPSPFDNGCAVPAPPLMCSIAMEATEPTNPWSNCCSARWMLFFRGIKPTTQIQPTVPLCLVHDSSHRCINCWSSCWTIEQRLVCPRLESKVTNERLEGAPWSGSRGWTPRLACPFFSTHM